jgi:hypothetical protein
MHMARTTKKLTPAICAAVAVMLLGGCADDAGYGRSSSYVSVNGRYWAGDGAFNYSDGGSNYRRDDGSDSRRNSARGYERF